MRPLLDSRRPAATAWRRYPAAARRRLARWRYRGDDVQCPCCRRTYRSYAPDWNRAAVICPGCGSHQRHRALCLYLEEHTDLGRRRQTLLHFAPEYCLRRRLESLPGVEYVAGDLEPEEGDLQLDITGLPFAAATFDAIICSHVLEHVEEDRRALAELYRVLRPGGWALVFVPLGGERTYEDATIRDPDRRLEAFGQHDHVRIYGSDIVDRLAAAGFDVRTERLTELLPEAALVRHGLTEEVFFRATRPAAPA